jgi:chorismate synthase
VGRRDGPRTARRHRRDPHHRSRAALTRPRPGHADLTGALKYGYDDVRDALERASARETAARVVVGTYAKHLLAEVGVHVVSHVVEIGGVRTPADAPRPGPDDLAAVDESPVRCLDAATEAEMVARIDAAHADNDTLGGTIEVLVHGAPAGLGSHVHWDRKLDARLAAACLSVQAMKGVEFGDGFDLASRPGSQAHDEIVREADGSYRRLTDRAGGIEAGMTTGQPVRLRSRDEAHLVASRDPSPRSTSTPTNPRRPSPSAPTPAPCPRAGVVLEAVVAIEIADALLEKTGGDTVAEVRRNLDGYLASIADR